MLRATAWTGGLFALGCGICHLFPGPFIEPLVLIGLGSTLLFVSGRAPSSSRAAAPAPAEPAPAGTRSIAR